MKKLILPLALIAGLAFTPLVLAADTTSPKKQQKQELMVITLKTSDGEKIRVLVHQDDVNKAKKLKKGDKVELYFIGAHGGGEQKVNSWLTK